MVNPNKYRLTALKLAQLGRSDQRWVLKQLPVNISQSIKSELAVLSKFGLENPRVLIESIEQENKRKTLSNHTQTILNNCGGLTVTECYLYGQSLLKEERDNFMLMLNDQRRDEVMQLGESRKYNMSPKFKLLFIEYLLKSLGTEL